MRVKERKREGCMSREDGVVIESRDCGCPRVDSEKDGF